MATPKIELKVINPTLATIEVDGEVVGNITVALEVQETIAGVDNALLVLGDCENIQGQSHHGFVFSLAKGLPKPEPEPVPEPTPETVPPVTAPTEPKGA